MRRLLIAATLGLGLLSAGGMAADAAAAAAAGTRAHIAPARAATDGHPLLTPAHYQRDFHHHGLRRPHYVPPSPPLRHHWYRVAPPPLRYHDGHARDRWHDRHPHGWQQHGWRR